MTTPEARSDIVVRVAVRGAAAVTVGLLLLSLPAPAPDAEPPSRPTPFRWDADLMFRELEDEFFQARRATSQDAGRTFAALMSEAEALVGDVRAASSPPHETLHALANLQFRMAARGAASPERLPAANAVFHGVRHAVMEAAVDWPSDRATQESLYRVLFGARIALDEALVQAGTDALPALQHFAHVSAATPSIEVEGVRVHSGDILLSRGGAPTSALIARGNDFANTFSHAALAYVDAETGEGLVVESLIETGSVMTTVEEYLAAKKHRILVLRLRPGHPVLRSDPMLPHEVARAALERVRREHIPYDFPMAWNDPSAAFCSEIIFHPYRDAGVELWSYRSSMSAPGLVRWLGAMGVREFTTLVPSDAEFDPQLRAVAEWRDAEALMDFRLDNAVIDALLEEAERGADFGYAWYALPVARLVKGYSVLQSWVGVRPTIPQGMSASTALRVDALVNRVHPTLKSDLARRAGTFRAENGFEAPYWTLVELARAALDALRPDLAPALAGG